MSDSTPTPKSTRLPGWTRGVLRFLIHGALPVFLALVAAVLVFNYLVMPRFVRHGEEVEVPDVTGRSLAEAENLLASAGLSVRDTTGRVNPIVPRGVVMEQDPRGDTPIKPDRDIGLVVSLGKREEQMPAISGQTLRFARLSLGQDGYQLGDVLRIPSRNVPRNFVVASDPPASTATVSGERVNLLVSDGPPARVWEMPDLRGQELRLTADKLRFAGFDVAVDDERPSAFGPRRILSTDPPAGSPVRTGDTIRLVGG